MARPPANDNGVALVLRAPRVDDGPGLWTLARNNGLDENSPYAYLLWAEYFASTSVVATAADRDAPIGFVTGFHPPSEPGTVFVWQIAVDAAHRQGGIAGRMLDELVTRTGASFLEATVTPSNVASETLFRRVAERHGADVVTEELFAQAHFPPGHEAEHRFRIGPLSSPAGPSDPPAIPLPKEEQRP